MASSQQVFCKVPGQTTRRKLHLHLDPSQCSGGLPRSRRRRVQGLDATCGSRNQTVSQSPGGTQLLAENTKVDRSIQGYSAGTCCRQQGSLQAVCKSHDEVESGGWPEVTIVGPAHLRSVALSLGVGASWPPAPSRNQEPDGIPKPAYG